MTHTSARSIGLNPCDYLYYAHHRLMERRAQGGNVAFLVMDAEGRADPQRVLDALAAAMLAHPATMASLRCALTTGWPRWSLPKLRPEVARRAAERAYLYDDLRQAPDCWEDRLQFLCQTRNSPYWNLAAPLQLRLEHYDLPGDQTRFCFRFPHVLMDAEGIQWFAEEMERLDPAGLQGGPPARPSGLADDDRPLDVLAEVPILRRLDLVRQAFRQDPDRRRLKVKPLLAPPPAERLRQRVLHKCWQARELVRMRANAKKWAPPGPARHARFLAMCVIRALHRVYAERGVKTDAYYLPFPVNLTAIESEANGEASRPVQGNYLVSSTLCAKRDIVEDRDALGRELLRQINDFIQTQGHLAQWSLIWLASFMRPFMYQWALRLPLGLESLASGFSYYGLIPQRARHIAGARITNIWGCAPMGMPPGWNPIFNKFEGKMNLVLSWTHPAIPEKLAHRYADLIEKEIFSSD